MADKKGNCGCGCIGQKQGSPKVTSDKKTPKKPKKSKQRMDNLAVKIEAVFYGTLMFLGIFAEQ